MTTVDSTAATERRATLAILKQGIKNDVEGIRTAKRFVREYQKAGDLDAAAANQSALAKQRREARAWLIVYGLLRGRTWEQMERNHPEGDDSLKHTITQTWIYSLGGSKLETPEALKPWLLK